MVGQRDPKEPSAKDNQGPSQAEINAARKLYNQTGIRLVPSQIQDNHSKIIGYVNGFENTVELKNFWSDSEATDTIFKAYQRVLAPAQPHYSINAFMAEYGHYRRKLEPYTNEDEVVEALKDSGFLGDRSIAAMVWAIESLMTRYPSMFDAKPCSDVEPNEVCSGRLVENIWRGAILVKGCIRHWHATSGMSRKWRPRPMLPVPARYLTTDEIRNVRSEDETQLYKPSALAESYADVEDMLGLAGGEYDIDEMGMMDEETFNERSKDADDVTAFRLTASNYCLAIGSTDNTMPGLTHNEKITLCQQAFAGVDTFYPTKDDLLKPLIEAPRPDDAALMLNKETLSAEEMQLARVNAEAEELGIEMNADDRELLHNNETKRAEFIANQKNMNQHSVKPPSYETACRVLGLKLPELPSVDESVVRDPNPARLFAALKEYAEPAFNDKLKLKSHQPAGIAWVGAMCRSIARGCILADDMGLGKTCVALATIVQGCRDAVKSGEPSLNTTDDHGVPCFRPSLILVPANTIGVWIHDIDELMGGEIVLKIWHGDINNRSNKNAHRTIATDFSKLTGYIGSLDKEDPMTERVVVLSSYGTYSRRALNDPYQNGTGENKDDELGSQTMSRVRIEAMTHRKPGLFARIICDEAHSVKGMMTKEHRSIKLTEAVACILITGTPISNVAPDLEGLLDLLWNPCYHEDLVEDDEGSKGIAVYTEAARYCAKWSRLPFSKKFSQENFLPLLPLLDPERFRTALRQSQSSGTLHSATTEVLPPIYNTLVLKRTKGVTHRIGKYDIPLGADIPIPHFRTVEIKADPHFTKAYNTIYMRELPKLGGSGKAKVDSDAAGSGGATVAGARRVTIAACSPHADTMFNRMTIHELKGNGAVPQGQDPMRTFWQWTRLAQWAPMYRDRPSMFRYMISLSPKLRYVAGRIGQWMLVERRKIIIFTYWPTNAYMIVLMLQALGVSFTTLKADDHTDTRMDNIRTFNDVDSKCDIMVTSLRVAATSLNLQSATRMIMVDVPPSYQQEMQAAARMYRIGVKEEQIIEILSTLDTYDQVLLARKEKKQIPIIAGTAYVQPTRKEIDNHMREKYKGLPSDLGKPSDEYHARAKAVKAELVEQKAKELYRFAIGARTSTSDWDDLNLDARKFLPGESEYTEDADELEERRALAQQSWAESRSVGIKLNVERGDVAKKILLSTKKITDEEWTLFEVPELRSIMVQSVQDQINNQGMGSLFKSGKKRKSRSKPTTIPKRPRLGQGRVDSRPVTPEAGSEIESDGSSNVTDSATTPTRTNTAVRVVDATARKDYAVFNQPSNLGNSGRQQSRPVVEQPAVKAKLGASTNNVEARKTNDGTVETNRPTSERSSDLSALSSKDPTPEPVMTKAEALRLARAAKKGAQSKRVDKRSNKEKAQTQEEPSPSNEPGSQANSPDNDVTEGSEARRRRARTTRRKARSDSAHFFEELP